MSNILVAYFSATGVTAKVAERLSEVLMADVFEIKPVVPYTEADLDWKNEKSRSSIEMKDPSSRPAIAEKLKNMDEYDIIYLGFPIWWYVAPTVINTFLEQYDFTGKQIVTFATSGGSDMGKTNEKLASSCPGAILLEGKVVKIEDVYNEDLVFVKEIKSKSKSATWADYYKNRTLAEIMEDNYDGEWN